MNIIKFLKFLRGSDHPNWKGGRWKKDDYWILCKPDYYASNKQGNVFEHIFVYEEFHKCCMLPWGVVHHKDFNKENNEISNLQGMMKGSHRALHSKGNRFRRGKQKDTSDRQCFKCKSKITGKHKPCGHVKMTYPKWYHLPSDPINWYCSICYRANLYRIKKGF